jgi:hypothetical protein
MKYFTAIVFAGLSLVGGVLLSLALTLVLWDTCVDGRLYQCTDDIGTGMIVSMYDHAIGGDTALAGWTWDGLERLRIMFLTAFFVIWIAGNAGGYFMLLRFQKMLPSRSPAL